MASVVPRVKTISRARTRVQEPLDLAPRLLVGGGGLFPEGVQGPVHVGVAVLVVDADGVQDRARLLGGGGVVQVRKGPAVHRPVEKGEVPPDVFHAAGADQLGFLVRDAIHISPFSTFTSHVRDGLRRRKSRDSTGAQVEPRTVLLTIYLPGPHIALRKKRVLVGADVVQREDSFLRAEEGHRDFRPRSRSVSTPIPPPAAALTQPSMTGIRLLRAGGP